MAPREVPSFEGHPHTHRLKSTEEPDHHEASEPPGRNVPSDGPFHSPWLSKIAQAIKSLSLYHTLVPRSTLHVQVMYHVTGMQTSARYVQRACERNRFALGPAESLHAPRLKARRLRPDLPVVGPGQSATSTTLPKRMQFSISPFRPLPVGLAPLCAIPSILAKPPLLCESFCFLVEARD